MTKNILPLLVAAALVTMLLGACANAHRQEENSLLWKISGNGLSSPSYLFGTHHLVPVSFLDSIPQWKSAFSETKQVVGEIDFNNQMEMQMKIMASSLLPEGVSYDSLMGKEDYKLLDSVLTDLTGIGMEQFDQMKPAMVNTLLSAVLYKKFYPSIGDGEDALDQFFQEEADNYYRPVVGLETADEQIALLFDSQPLKRQAELLLCTVKHPNYVKRRMDEMQTAYYAQNLNAMAELLDVTPADAPCPDTPAEKDTMNKNRNEKWMEKLPAIMASKPSFIVVGCLHLVGKNGLIRLLRKQGYVVEAVK